MKRFYPSIIATALSVTAFTGCSKFDAINTNPNATTSVTPALLATNLILNITGSSADKSFVTPYMTSKHMAWGELAQGEQYNNFGRSGLGGMVVLTDALKMASIAQEVDKKAYTALGTFVKAYKLYYISMGLGDIPYSDAFGAENGNIRPVYDDQKKVMTQVLADLEAAEKLFSEATNFSGDPTAFNGNVAAWRRAVNSFRLKVLMSLSKKTGEADLRIKEQFALVAALPLLRSNADNLQTVYANRAGQIYPYNNNGFKGTAYAMLSTTLVDMLKKMNDYRLFYFASPSLFAVKTEGKTPDSWDAYRGTDVTVEFSEIAKLYTAGKHSAVNPRYTELPSGEPVARISYAEQNFILAEAAVRGWISGNARTYYDDGIKAAMNFIVSATPDETKYHNGRKMTSAYIGDYLLGAEVAFAATSDLQLKQIWSQKYILYFMQHPWEAYYECRRTGYPELPVNAATSANPDDKTKIPVRWMYGNDEYTYNRDNLKVALDRQFAGSDKTSDVMWIIK